MSDNAFESSPDEPWITEEEEIKASPAAVDLETGKEKDIEQMADPAQQGDFPEPSPPSLSKKSKKITDEEKWEEYLEAFEELNKLKRNYDKKIESSKKNFLKKNPNASSKEKKKAIEEYKSKMRCLNCGKPGGTIFNSPDGFNAKCGNIDNPCNLRIKIKKPTVFHIPNQLDQLRKEIILQKRIITEYKLDLLFDLDNEEVILNEFQNNKENLEKILTFANEMQDYYDRNTSMVEIPQINPDTGEEITDQSTPLYVSRKEQLDIKHKEFNQYVSDFKKNIKLYNQNGENSLLNDSIQNYKNIIIPLQKQIRNLKYQVVYLDKISQSNNKLSKKEMPIFHFISKYIDIQNQVIQNNDFEVDEYQK